MNSELKEAIGTTVRAARTAARLTQEELAERVNVHADSISLIERGKTLPSVATLIEIADVLHVPTAAILPKRQVDEVLSSRRARIEAEIQVLIRALPEKHLELVRDQVAALHEHLTPPAGSTSR